MKQFFKEVVWCFYPPRYKILCTKKLRSSLKFMSLVLFFAFIIAAVLYAPKLITLKSSIEDQLDNFVLFNINANFTTSAPVKIPYSRPLFIIDSAEEHNISNELFIFSQDKIKYRFFGKHSVPLSTFKDVKANKKRASAFFSVLFILLLPSIFILLYFKFWIKYFLIIYLISFILFILLELTHWRLKFRQILNIACHTSIIMIVLELVSAPFGTAYLLPLVKFLGINIYAVTLVLFAFFTVAGVIFANKK